MPSGRRQFLRNKDEAHRFRLVARSSADPAADDADATPLVLEPFVRPGAPRRTGRSEAELLAIPETLERTCGADAFGLGTCAGRERAGNKDELGSDDEDEDPDAVLDEDCYFPKDGYNYDQHMKHMSRSGRGGVVGVVLEAPKPKPHEFPPISAKQLKLPPATNQEEKDLLRALELVEEYDEFDGIGSGDEDDITLDAIVGGGVLREDEVLWGPHGVEDKIFSQNLPDLVALKAAHAAYFTGEAGDDEEDPDAAPGTGNFEQFLVEDYAEGEIGELDDDDEIEGQMTLEELEGVCDEYLEERKVEDAKLTSFYEPQERVDKLDDVPRVIEETRALIDRHYRNMPHDLIEEEDDGEFVSADQADYSVDPESTRGGESDDESKNWDCETVLSNLSNVSNRPGKIGRIKIVRKERPAKQLEKVNEDEAADSEEDEDILELPDVITERPKNETPEEKRLRKASVKEMRRVCRRMKKESKEVYKAELMKLPSQQAGNGDVRSGLRNVKL